MTLTLVCVTTLVQFDTYFCGKNLFLDVSHQACVPRLVSYILLLERAIQYYLFTTGVCVFCIDKFSVDTDTFHEFFHSCKSPNLMDCRGQHTWLPTVQV